MMSGRIGMNRVHETADTKGAQVADRDAAMEVGAHREGHRPVVELENVQIAFSPTNGSADGRPFVAVDDISLQVANGEFLSIVGPSGCGKTTILNLLAGLLRPTRGEARRFDKPITGPSRDIGYMLSSAALSPWRTARKNVELGLEIRGVAREARRERALRLLEQVGVGDFANAFPSQLSHGMQQRVAIARTLAIEPQLWLMDEPFGALDAQTRLRIQAEFVALWEEVGNTVVFVTHDLTEAVLLSDRVILMSRGGPGRIRLDTPIDIERPRDLAALRFDEHVRDLEAQIWEELRQEFES